MYRNAARKIVTIIVSAVLCGLSRESLNEIIKIDSAITIPVNNNADLITFDF